MAYSDKIYFLTRIDESELSKLTGGGDQGDTNLAEAIADADEKIDSYLKSIITSVPLTTVPKVIRRCSYDIAMYYLHDRSDFADLPESIEKKYKDAISYLESLVAGKAQLPTVAPENKETRIDFDCDPGILHRGMF